MQCCNTIRQWGTAGYLYADQFDQYMCPVFVARPPNNSWTAANNYPEFWDAYWTDTALLGNYVGNVTSHWRGPGAGSMFGAVMNSLHCPGKIIDQANPHSFYGLPPPKPATSPQTPTGQAISGG